MAATLLLDRTTWDLVTDAAGNIAVATDPYSQAQDAASAIKTQQGECYWDTSVGVPLFSQVLGQRPSIALQKSLYNAAALTVPGVVVARTFITSLKGRTVTGQVQTTNEAGATSAVGFSAAFATINPQGAG